MVIVKGSNLEGILTWDQIAMSENVEIVKLSVIVSNNTDNWKFSVKRCLDNRSQNCTSEFFFRIFFK